MIFRLPALIKATNGSFQKHTATPTLENKVPPDMIDPDGNTKGDST
jgi:hypothetical protein